MDERPESLNGLKAVGIIALAALAELWLFVGAGLAITELWTIIMTPSTRSAGEWVEAIGVVFGHLLVQAGPPLVILYLCWRGRPKRAGKDSRSREN
jgi:hypothetical protein